MQKSLVNLRAISFVSCRAQITAERPEILITNKIKPLDFPLRDTRKDTSIGITGAALTMTMPWPGRAAENAQ
jgi:hypothetical protein